MTKIIAISGEIGWDVWPNQIRREIEDAKGEDLEFHISSPGGYIFEGLEIFNLIRSYPGNTTTIAIGEAASMASYLLMAGDKKKCVSNAVFMIHNARAFEYGDQHDHRRLANILEGMSNLLGQEYVRQTGKSKDEIQALMRDESFFFGQEILDAGFVDEIAEVENLQTASANRSEAVAHASMRVAAVIQKLKEKPEDCGRLAAVLKPKNATSSFKDYPISEASWDSAAAIQRVREKSNSTEEPSASYKNAFFWYDPEETDNFGGYKLPFVDVENDNYVAVKNGVDAAYAAMQGGRGGVNIPESDRPAVMAHIERYRRKIYGDDEEDDSSTSSANNNIRQGANITQQEFKMSDQKLHNDFITLDEFVASHPGIKDQYEKRLGEAKTQGYEEGVQAKQQEIERIYPLISAEGASRALIEQGFKALKEGGQEVSVFVGIANYEARLHEQKASAKADEEQPKDTSVAPKENQNAANPKNAEDMKGLAAQLKKQIL